MRRGTGVMWSVLALLSVGAQATDVPLRVTDPTLLAAVQGALAALSVNGASYSLVNGSGPLFSLGGTVAFSPDVASRSFGGLGPDARVEFNPQGPLPLAEAVQGELRRLLKLPALAVATAGDSASGTSASGTSVNGTSTTATSTTATSTSADSVSGSSTLGTSTTGSSTAGTSSSGTSSAGTSSFGTSTTAVSVAKKGPADLNSDGVVDTADFAIMMASLGKTGKGLPADLNGDGKVDEQDLNMFTKLYTLP